MYGAVIVADLFFVAYQGIDTRKKTIFCLSWGLSAVLISALTILLSNLRFFDMALAVETFSSVVNQVGTEGSDAYLSMILCLSPLFTPAMVILSLIGFLVIVRKKDRVWIPIIVGLLGVLPWLRSGAPKNLITFIPVTSLMLFCGAYGGLGICPT